MYNNCISKKLYSIFKIMVHIDKKFVKNLNNF